MTEASIYEGRHPRRIAQEGAVCLGVITAVNPASRLCTVKTIAYDPQLNDKHIDACQWLNWDSSPAGDEATSVPRRGSLGVVIFIMGEPYIFGYIKGLNAKAQALTGKEPANLTEGDKVLSTQGGNRITVKASGLVEVFVKDTLKTYYIPFKSQLLNLCRNYELKADGGFWQWFSDDKAFTCLSQQLFRKDLANSLVVFEQRGNTGDGMLRTTVAPGVALGALNLYDHLVDDTGKSTWSFGTPVLLTLTADVDGTYDIDAASDIGFTSKTGDLNLAATLGAVNVTADAGDVDIEATAGTVALTGSLAKLKLADGMVGLGTDAAELVDLFNQTLQLFGQTLQAIGMLTVIGNLGYTSSPPVNLPDFVQLQTQVIALQTRLQTIMGGV